ncbi:MAG TPA: nitroreductase family protein [Methanosarcinales archaeon]|nr:nitroreductase family protein [Methanosarcinales archaeon]
MLVDILKKRCSVRNFEDKEIRPDMIDAILEAGRLSPSGGNEQAWKFGVITDISLIEQIAEAAYKQSWIKTAPLLIVLCTTMVEDERGGREIQKRRFPKHSEAISNMDKYLYLALNSEEHQTKIPGTHMVLQALEYGIYSTWISYFEVDKVSRLLKLPKLCIPSEIIAFGYPADKPSSKDKKCKEEIIFYNKFKE